MSMQNRLDKLLFIVKELEVAYYIASTITDGFVSRTIARHVLVRAKDFLDHVRPVKNLLRDLGHDVRRLERAIRTYSDYFTEYFEDARHTLGGHVQDLDFGERIELWNAIETVKAHFFVESAIEIYRDLIGPMGPAGYQPFVSSADVSNAATNGMWETLNSVSLLDAGPRFGTDVLAHTRPNTGGIIHFADVQQRSGQLLAIKPWVEIELALLGTLDRFPDVQTILMSRLITDIVSFADCLITRRDVTTAHTIEGLNSLLIDEEVAVKIFSQFLANIKFDEHLAPIRRVRNRIGGHVEESEHVGIADIKAELYALRLDITVEFFLLLDKVFRYICRSILFLKPFLISGERINGVISVSESGAVVPFGPSTNIQAYERKRLDLQSEASYEVSVDNWLLGGAHADEARDFFFDAFIHSQEVERIEETEVISEHFTRITGHSWRKAHQYILERWLAETERGRAYQLLELVKSLCNTDSYAVTTLISRYIEAGGELVEREDLWMALAEIGYHPHQAANELLVRDIRAGSPITRMTALVALFQTSVNGQFSERANKGHYEPILPALLGALSQLSKRHQYIVLLAWLSRIATGYSGLGTKYFSSEVEAIKTLIHHRFEQLTRRSRLRAVRSTFNRLLRANNCAGLALILELGISRTKRRHSEVLLAIPQQLIRVSPEPHEQTMAVYCMQLIGQHRRAFDLATHIAEFQPTVVFPQFLALVSLMKIPKARAQARGKLAYIREFYRIKGKWAKKARLADTEFLKLERQGVKRHCA